VFAPFLIILIIIIILSFFLSSAKSLSDTFLGDYWTENYVPQTKFGRHIVLAPFLIIIIILLLLSFFCQKFIRHISRRLLNGNQWNFTGMLSTMSRCADYFRNFQNGCRCHGNGQNAKKLKNTKMIKAGYSPNRNWWNLIGTTSTSSGTR
jgi:phosphatidylglycerophosphate synthase